jgi:hypothetical protein
MAQVDRVARPSGRDARPSAPSGADPAPVARGMGPKAGPAQIPKADARPASQPSLLEAVRAKAAGRAGADAPRRADPERGPSSPPAATDLQTRMALENRQAADKATEAASRRAVRAYGEA